MTKSTDQRFMQMAVELASRGQGHVEPNPMVGCVLVRDDKVIGKGYHQRFGGPHAEIEALRSCDDATGATAYVTLEPCCHHGKTPPCTSALIKAGVRRVVLAVQDPFEKVAGNGIDELKQAGIEVECGVGAQEARSLIRPYAKRVQSGMPWVIAKWAMTLDGKIATATGASQWISGPSSRAVVHRIRGCVDAIMVGIGTALADDPLLTARPSGPRTAVRIVVDSLARLPLHCQLVETANQYPTLVAAGSDANIDQLHALENAGCQIKRLQASDHASRMRELLSSLADAGMTNILVEGGSHVLGCMLDESLIDEVHCFVAPKIVGGAKAPSPIGGSGVATIPQALSLKELNTQQLDQDIYIWGDIDQVDATS